MKRFWFLLIAIAAPAETVRVTGLKQPVEVLRDKWGVPHIYAKNADDLFFAQGYITARDRLFQLDLWRRINTGRLAEVQGPSAIARDRIARLVRFRGDWTEEWTAYSPDTRPIVTAFVNGINAHIKSLNNARPIEFRIAGYSPGLWEPEDCVARIAGLLMTRNVARELDRALEVRDYGIETVQRLRPPDPFVPLRVPKGLDLASLTEEILRDYTAATGLASINADSGSNNWVVDGTRTVTGKPILANDPHRPMNIPSLRKTVHLVAPGWNIIGAGEPALPGIALGHNEQVGFGFTIVGIDQGDLFVERLNPANPDEYFYKGAWKKMEIEKQSIAVKGRGVENVELRHTVHGPVIYEDRRANRAYALKWVGAEPGGAGYLAALALSRTKNWTEFRNAAAQYKVPSENLVYADKAGNIGWIASGRAPLRKGWDGLFPVPGDSGDYEWTGFLPIDQHPQEYNPPRHWIATANHNILPSGYKHMLSYEWASPFRYLRLAEMLGTAQRKFSVTDFEKMQLDVTSHVARRFQDLLRKHLSRATGEFRAACERMLRWDARMAVDSSEATLFAVWFARLPAELDSSPLATRMNADVALRFAETAPITTFQRAWQNAMNELKRGMGPDPLQWQWGKLHRIRFEHPLRVPRQYEDLFHRRSMATPGDSNTVNAASGANFRHTAGASYRQILDLADWDNSVVTNVPGESGNPESRHYSDLLEDWLSGRYHPLPYSRKAVEAATEERIQLLPR